MPAATTRTVRKVVADFPEALFHEADRVAAELGTNRSRFIRLAVESFIRERHKRKLERELIEGYTANADYARRIAEDFAHVDSDLT
jgi:metal-responsive CopG/Arc/MetJ family transcriptional regulator